MSASAKNQNAMFQLFEEGVILGIDALSEASGISRYETIKTAGYLINRGYLCRARDGVFMLTEKGLQARLDEVEIRSGPMGPDSGKGRKPFKETLRQRAWSAMRVMSVFSTAEIVAVACDDPSEKDHANIRRFCRALRGAKILLDMPSRARGAAETSNGFKRYRLFEDLGEIAPTYRNTKKEVFDHNSREVFSCQMQ